MSHMRVRRLFAGERVARFGTAGPGGRPHLIPVPFAMIDDGDDGVVVCVIDHEPQSLAGRARLHEIAAFPRVSFLVDHGGRAMGIAGPPASQWWVQVDAVAEVLRPSVADPRHRLAVEALAERYPRYRERRPRGPVIWSTVTEWTGWTSGLVRAA